MWIRPTSLLDEKKTKQRISVLVFPSDEVLYLPLTITISQI